MNERKGSGRLSGPGSRDILDFRGDGDGDGNGVGDGFVGDGYGDVRSDEAGDEGGDSDNHRSTNIPEPGVDVEDEADVRTIRGFGGPDEDDIRNTRIRIGIGDVKRYDGGDLEGGDSGGGGDTDIRDMIRVRGEDPHLHLRSRSGMEVDLNMDRNRDRNRDMLMRMDPDMVRVLKSIYGWGDREVSSPPLLPPSSISSRACDLADGMTKRSEDLARLIPFLLLLRHLPALTVIFRLGSSKRSVLGTSRSGPNTLITPNPPDGGRDYLISGLNGSGRSRWRSSVATGPEKKRWDRAPIRRKPSLVVSELCHLGASSFLL